MFCWIVSFCLSFEGKLGDHMSLLWEVHCLKCSRKSSRMDWELIQKCNITLCRTHITWYVHVSLSFHLLYSLDTVFLIIVMHYIKDKSKNDIYFFHTMKLYNHFIFFSHTASLKYLMSFPKTRTSFNTLHPWYYIL